MPTDRQLEAALLAFFPERIGTPGEETRRRMADALAAAETVRIAEEAGLADRGGDDD